MDNWKLEWQKFSREEKHQFAVKAANTTAQDVSVLTETQRNKRVKTHVDLIKQQVGIFLFIIFKQNVLNYLS